MTSICSLHIQGHNTPEYPMLGANQGCLCSAHEFARVTAGEIARQILGLKLFRTYRLSVGGSFTHSGEQFNFSLDRESLRFHILVRSSVVEAPCKQKASTATQMRQVGPSFLVCLKIWWRFCKFSQSQSPMVQGGPIFPSSHAMDIIKLCLQRALSPLFTVMDASQTCGTTLTSPA